MGSEDKEDRFRNSVEGLEAASDAEEYTFAQLADVQIGMMRAMGNVQWLIKYRTVVQLMSLCQQSGKKQIPIPTVKSDIADLKGESLYRQQVEMELELSERAVKILNDMQPKPKVTLTFADPV